MPTLPERILTLFATYHIRREKVLADLDALYAPDVRFVDPFNDVTGKDRFLRINENLFKRLREMRFDDLALVGEEPHFMLSWTATIEGPMGLTLTAPGVSEFRSESGVVVFHRDHWDVLSSMAASVPGVRMLYPRLTAMFFER
ncbi:MAG TPA: nuclear transport factor 2 family protein [Polyangium sp.]|nr:nuclear transport factor 2 family protein [Polyangium sp.]